MASGGHFEFSRKKTYFAPENFLEIHQVIKADPLTLKALNYFRINHEDQRVYSI